jgi:hypothetical protein
MALYTTRIRAIDPTDGEMKEWQGPHIEAIGFFDARQICQDTGRGYLEVTGRLDKEISLDGTVLVDARPIMN